MDVRGSCWEKTGIELKRNKKVAGILIMPFDSKDAYTQPLVA
jgi:hypothetical protein